ncbi:11063_t:CDS:2 [Ambispora gerdemannii]|uniref:Probable RNA polymerase II nuclear localization protein SLC7A6OS n=1 Tax=Ambispora gerdemannii TaxID=144530 RepID=A0A9N9F7Q7_9GLOM|nr:11063_t:CDS:2 [Ambispora gerdemannii]
MEPNVNSQIPKETSPQINKSTLDSTESCITPSETGSLENSSEIPPNSPNLPSQNEIESETVNSVSPGQEKSTFLITTDLEETTYADKEAPQTEMSITTTSSLPERVEQPPDAKDNTIFTNYIVTTNNVNNETQISTTIPPTDSSSKELIIVRVKRKRNEEPLDAFAHSSADALTAYFRFAETVDEMTFEHSAKTLQLEERIRNRLRKNQKDEDLKKRFKDHHGKKRDQFKEDKHTARYQIIQNRRYKNNNEMFIDQEDNNNNIVMSGTTESLKVFDAVKQVDDNDKNVTISSKPTHRDDVMEKFLPMVMDYMSYLNIKDHDDDEDDEYVYDVFYRDDNFVKGFEDHYRNVASLVWLEDDDNEYLLDEADIIDTDDEDSNAENYYTHDYPEEEGDEKWEEDGGKIFNYDSECDGNQSSDEEEYYA